MIVKLLNFYAVDGAVHIGASDGEKTVDVSAVGYSWGWQEIFADWEKIRPQIESVLQHAKPLAHGLHFAPVGRCTSPPEALSALLNLLKIAGYLGAPKGTSARWLA